MEDLPGDLQPDLKPRTLPRPTKRNSRWTLLFVGDHGRTVLVRRFKGLFYLMAGLLLVAAGAAAGLYLVNRQAVDENRRMKAKIARLGETVEALRYDRDVLTARLVLTEAELQKEKSGRPDGGKPRAEDSPAAASAAEQDPAAASPEPEPARVQEVAAAGREVDGPEAGPAPADAPEVASSSVGVENLSVTHEQDRDLLRVTFVIRKDDPEPENVSGHAFVVLKPGGEAGAAQWVPMPHAAIEGGLPIPAKRGQYFSIARFKPMKFEKTGVPDPKRFQELTVFVFDTGGKLLLEQEFSMDARRFDAG